MGELQTLQQMGSKFSGLLCVSDAEAGGFQYYLFSIDPLHSECLWAINPEFWDFFLKRGYDHILKSFSLSVVISSCEGGETESDLGVWWCLDCEQ